MKTFQPSLTSPSFTTVPMTTVSTQTDGCVEMAYQELCGSSSMAMAIDIYDWEEDEECKVDDFTGSLQRVMSSQTDLALSDFDLSRCLQWEDEEDEEEEEDRILQGQDGFEDDTYNDNNETCHSTMTMTEEPASQPQPDSTSSSKGSPMCETTSRKSPKTRPPTKESKQHLQRPLYSEKRFLEELKKRSDHRPPNGYHRMENLAKGMAHVQLSESLALASCMQDVTKKQRYCFRDRMVPRMGTKIEFLKTFPNRDLVQIPGLCPQHAVFPTSGPDTGVKAGDRNAARFVYADCQENFLVNAYHSDSENSYASIRGGSHHKDWSSDGDAAHALDENVGQSLNIVNNELLNYELLSPESRCRAESLRTTQEQFTDVMYTNEANLQHTIMLQQRLFKQQLATRKLHDIVSNCRKVANNPLDVAKPYVETAKDTCQVQAEIHPTPTSQCSDERTSPLEWIVKRRPDGSRYITRRPVRSKLLKERAKQLAAQHDNVLTTDDETASEVKIGRYWSKEERKRHLEKARNQKRHRETMMKTRPSKEESPKQEGSPTMQQQHKLTKQQSRKIVGNFTTLKELMLQRGAESKGKPFSPLLSVTTI